MICITCLNKKAVVCILQEKIIAENAALEGEKKKSLHREAGLKTIFNFFLNSFLCVSEFFITVY